MESNRQNAPLLQVQGLTVSFSRYAKGFRRVTLPGVRDLSFSLDEGELVAVVGASGSGKSLLAHRLLGILPKNAQVGGQVLYRGQALDDRLAEKLRGREIVLVPQNVSYLDPLMRVFGATSDILDYSLTYTGITSLGFPFLILATGGSSLIRADGSPRFSMFCTLAGAVINTILDPLFIFGFDMGMAGAAWATVIGQVVSGFMVIGYLTRFKTVKLTWKSLGLRPGYCLQVVALGMSPFCNQLAMMVVQIVLNNSLTYYGGLSDYGSEIPLACAGIISKVGMIYFAVVIGIAQGLQPIVSFNYGAKKYDRVKETVKKASMASLIISLAAFVVFQLFPRQIISIFGSGSEEYFLFAERYFHIYMFFTFLNWLQCIASNFFTSIGKAIRGVFLSLTRQIIFLLPLILLLPLVMGIDGIMYAAPAADLIAAILAAVFLKKEFGLMDRESGKEVFAGK